MSLVYLGLGSNLEQPIAQLKRALALLNTHPDISALRFAKFYRSKPLAGSPGDQPDYINTVAEINTHLTPLDLLHTVLDIEQQMGRRQKPRWAARVIDIDILLYDNQEIQHERLQIPHYDLYNRAFFVVPLHELNPNLNLPNGTALSTLLEQLQHDLLECL